MAAERSGQDDQAARRIEADSDAKKEVPAAPSEIAVAPAILERYVGSYAISPAFVLAVTREGDHLFLQATGQPRFPLFASSERTFFLKVVDAKITFDVDAEGRATRLTLHQNGTDMLAPRSR
jgi:D-alanyl-D-alanine-carboxypeptidase/D-alanyl-D-alanine-endopeptidase